MHMRIVTVHRGGGHVTGSETARHTTMLQPALVTISSPSMGRRDSLQKQCAPEGPFELLPQLPLPTCHTALLCATITAVAGNLSVRDKA
jgi:hypothetical protein